MFGATEAGRVLDVHGAALRIHSDDISAEAGHPVVILEMKEGAVMLTRSQWAMVVSLGDQVLGIHEDTAEGQQRRTQTLAHPQGNPYPDGTPWCAKCGTYHDINGGTSPYACICGKPIPRGAFLAGYRVCREHLPNPGYAGTYDKAAGQDGAR